MFAANLARLRNLLLTVIENTSAGQNVPVSFRARRTRLADRFALSDALLIQGFKVLSGRRDLGCRAARLKCR